MPGLGIPDEERIDPTGGRQEALVSPGGVWTATRANSDSAEAVQGGARVESTVRPLRPAGKRAWPAV
jgi:hypothetical protein